MGKHLYSLFLLLCIATCIATAHEQWVHQYVVREAYQALRVQLGFDILVMADHVGTTEIGDGLWRTSLMVSGAWLEDCEDVMYHTAGIAGERVSIHRVCIVDNVNRTDTINASTESKQKRSAALQMKLGIKSGENGVPGTKLGLSFGVAAKIPLSEKRWDLNGEYNYWTAFSDNPIIKERVSLQEYTILLTLNIPLQSFVLRLSGGTGWAKVKKDREKIGIPSETVTLLPINVSIIMVIPISSWNRFLVEVRQQVAGSPSPGGGDIYKPLIMRFGFEVDI